MTIEDGDSSNDETLSDEIRRMFGNHLKLQNDNNKIKGPLFEVNSISNLYDEGIVIKVIEKIQPLLAELSNSKFETFFSN